MKLTIEINVSTAAFEDNFGAELTQLLLRSVVGKAKTLRARQIGALSDRMALADSNGNSIGYVKLTDREGE